MVVMIYNWSLILIWEDILLSDIIEGRFTHQSKNSW